MSSEHVQQKPTFTISSVMSWMGVACMLLAQLGAQIGDATLSDVPSFVFVTVFLVPATLCIPFLVEIFRQTFSSKNRNLEFSVAGKSFLVICVGLYSMLMFMGSSNLFNAEWKGAKGNSLWFYMLEHNASFTWWPSYLFGAIVFMYAVCQERHAVSNMWIFVCMVIQAVISFCYTFACIFMDFSDGPFAIIPGSCAICYTLFALVIYRKREWSLANKRHQWMIAVTSIGAFVAGAIAKYPLAKAFYEQLPDEPPDNCFVVTAATRGHKRFVCTWYDPEAGRVVNQQLLNLWRFEAALRNRFPRLHAVIRCVYNRIGPKLASLVFFKWQADLVYLGLKPLELIAVVAVRVCSSKKN